MSAKTLASTLFRVIAIIMFLGGSIEILMNLWSHWNPSGIGVPVALDAYEIVRNLAPGVILYFLAPFLGKLAAWKFRE
jgi:hypothetical protein